MKKIREKSDYRLYVFCAVTLVLVGGYSLLQQGIMCNDELLLRLYGQRGVIPFLKKTIINECILKGRVLGAIGNLKVLSFLSDNLYVFRFIDVLVILLTVIFFGYFVFKLFNNKWFSLTVVILLWVFLPITFEFAVPNAFVIVCCQPLMLLIFSFVLYIKYLETDARKYLLLSLMLYLWAMFLYEFIITYIFVYPIMYFVKKLKYKLDVKKCFLSSLPVLGVAVFYLILYILQGAFFKTQYSGTKLGIRSIRDVLDVIKMLAISACPGYYAFINNKHAYLFELYNQGGVKADNLINPSLVIFVISLFLILKMLLQHKFVLKNKRETVAVMLFIALYCFLPALPNAVSLMYQGNVTPDNFTSLPVSIYLYFSNVLLISYILWNFKTYINKIALDYILVFLILLVSVRIQVGNTVFAKEQYNNFQRIVNIENVLKLEYFDRFGAITIVSPSFFETRNSLAVESDHWTQFAETVLGKKIEVLDEYGEKGDIYIEMQDDATFFVYWENNYVLISKQNKNGEIALRNINKHYEAFQIGDCIFVEDEYKIYSLSRIE